MLELAPEDFYKVKPLLEGGHQYPEIISIIEHTNPGWIFVDQAPEPRSALVWSKGMQGFYLIGDHTNKIFTQSLDKFISTDIELKMKEQSLHHFEVSGHHNDWDYEALFPSRKLYPFEQLVFNSFNKPGGITNRVFNAINLKQPDWENGNFKNNDFIQDHIHLFWSSSDAFRDKGFGLAAVDGSEIIGVCYSSFVTADTHAIGIETVDRYQNKGVGTYLAALLVEELQNHGFIPYWDCSLDNEGSRKLAIRLGFQQIHRYQCTAFEI